MAWPISRGRLGTAVSGLVLLAGGLAVGGCGSGSAESTDVPGEVAFELHEQNDANVAGARALLRYEGKHSTLVTVDGLDTSEQPGAGRNPVRIVRGSCERPGAVAFRLPPLTASGSEKRIAVGIDELYEGDYAVQVLFTQDEAEALACGDVPDEPPA
jgi:hypothetical protein